MRTCVGSLSPQAVLSEENHWKKSQVLFFFTTYMSNNPQAQMGSDAWSKPSCSVLILLKLCSPPPFSLYVNKRSFSLVSARTFQYSASLCRWRFHYFFPLASCITLQFLAKTPRCKFLLLLRNYSIYEFFLENTEVESLLLLVLKRRIMGNWSRKKKTR